MGLYLIGKVSLFFVPSRPRFFRSEKDGFSLMTDFWSFSETLGFFARMLPVPKSKVHFS